VLCRFTAFVAADVQVVNEGGVVHRVLQPVEAPAGWDMLRRVAAAMPMAAVHGGGLQAAPFGGRVATPRVQRAMLDRRLGGLPGRAGPGRPSRRRSGGLPSHPLGGADLTPYRQRAGALVTMLERDRAHPRGSGADLGRRLGLVRVGVEALVADLESVDAVEEAVRPLRELAAELGRRLGPGLPGRPDLERLRDRVLAVLRAFAAPGPPPTAAEPRDPGFWRR
jgi:Ca-activated chloride channel family protein